jgi:Spy/CpxP family protein refolding chaperone
MYGRRLSAVLASAVLALTALSAWAEGDAGGPPAAARRDPLAGYRAVGIDKEQESKLTAIAKEFEGEMIAKTGRLIALMKEMHALSLQPDPEQNAVLAKQDEINKANGDIALARVRLVLKMRGVLTAEQKQKFIQLLDKGGRKTDAPQAGASQSD